MDKAAIFHGITQRNVLRKAAQMPLLDVRKEFERLVALQALDEYYTLREAQYADVRERLLDTVSVERKAEYGPQFGGTGLGTLSIRIEAERRFKAFLERRGIYMPYVEPMCIYGSHKKKV